MISQELKMACRESNEINSGRPMKNLSYFDKVCTYEKSLITKKNDSPPPHTHISNGQILITLFRPIVKYPEFSRNRSLGYYVLKIDSFVNDIRSTQGELLF